MVTNYVANASISGFNIEMILKIPGVRYRPNGFPATVIATNDRIINLYDSGKISSTKNTTETKAIKSLHDFLKEINDMGSKCIMKSKPVIAMISGIVQYDGIIDIDSLKSNPHYTKDIGSFPAIQMSYPNGVAIKAFSTKLVITASAIDSMISAIQEIAKYVIRDES